MMVMDVFSEKNNIQNARHEACRREWNHVGFATEMICIGQQSIGQKFSSMVPYGYRLSVTVSRKI